MSDIKHAHLYGMREAKYDWLSTHDVNSTDWNEIESQKPFYLFIPQNNNLLGEYQAYWKITEVIPINGVGMTTARDHVVIDFDKEPILERTTFFRDSTFSDEQICKELDIPEKKGWDIKKSRKLIKQEDNLIKNIVPILYRPFDNRQVFYHDSLIWRTVRKVMQHMLGDNLALITVRQVAEGIFSHSLVTELIIDNRLTLSNKGCAQLFPLYLYPNIDNPQTSTTEQQRRPNLSDEFLTEITNKLGYTPTPEAIFYYIYAIFHSPTYRTRYAEFLKIDFPRVPLTSDDQLFRKLGEYGEELVALHLMKSPKLDQHLSQIIDKGGEFVVDAGHPKYSDGEVIINKKGDRFTGVPKSVWEFYVGGYQVCHKWLKDRKGRQLSPEDLNHYQKIIVALSETMQIMNAIDAAIPSFPIE
jgi:predicted helicase